MKSKKSRIITILLIFAAIFSVGFPLCTMNRIILPLEKYKIETNADDIILDYFLRHRSSNNKERIVENSIEVHAIESFDGEVMMMFSFDTIATKPDSETLEINYHNVSLFSLVKDQSENGYELASGGSMGVSYPLSPVNWCGDGDISYGTINDDTITKIQIDYTSGDTITHELNGANYYLFKKPQTTGFNKVVAFRAYDKDGKLIVNLPMIEGSLGGYQGSNLPRQI